MNEEVAALDFTVSGVLEKFDGDSTAPEDILERIHIENNVIVKKEFFENGVLIGTELIEEGGIN